MTKRHQRVRFDGRSNSINLINFNRWILMKFKRRKYNEFNLIDIIEYTTFVKLSGKWFFVEK